MHPFDDLGRVAEQDQWAAAMASSKLATESLAQVVATFYRALRRDGVPRQHALPLTAQFQAQYWARVMASTDDAD